MKYLLFFSLTFLSFVAKSQIKQDNLYGTWVACTMTYNDGGQLEDVHPLKNTYAKYTFTYPNKFNPSSVYSEKGNNDFFEINNNVLVFKTPEGGNINAVKIERLQKDTLIVLQSGRNGFDDPTALKYYFVPESIYQKSIPLKPENIRSVNGKDTIYKECAKIYAKYQGESFLRDIYTGIDKYTSMDGRAGVLSAIFIVSKLGVPDSLKILESFDDKFNPIFIKVFNRLKKDWKPAILNDKYVAVQMEIRLKYGAYNSSDPEETVLVFKANSYYNNNDFDSAIYYYDKAIELKPDDLDALYKRGMAKMALGNIKAACEDWNRVKALGGTKADEALAKYCK
ncbi:MAG TPA: tetratricopeptide repeat protein [Mucilaginibacter sp.]|jgi:tetratricopeptide (TPR) repeat protein|nr:tetratricopeptide repeat protein [Mucilaginibacter sp.]